MKRTGAAILSVLLLFALFAPAGAELPAEPCVSFTQTALPEEAERETAEAEGLSAESDIEEDAETPLEVPMTPVDDNPPQDNGAVGESGEKEPKEKTASEAADVAGFEIEETYEIHRAESIESADGISVGDDNHETPVPAQGIDADESLNSTTADDPADAAGLETEDVFEVPIAENVETADGVKGDEGSLETLVPTESNDTDEPLSGMTSDDLTELVTDLSGDETVKEYDTETPTGEWPSLATPDETAALSAEEIAQTQGTGEAISTASAENGAEAGLLELGENIEETADAESLEQLLSADDLRIRAVMEPIRLQPVPGGCRLAGNLRVIVELENRCGKIIRVKVRPVLGEAALASYRLLLVDTSPESAELELAVGETGTLCLEMEAADAVCAVDPYHLDAAQLAFDLEVSFTAVEP